MSYPGVDLADTGLIMYIVLRRDLWRDLGWPLGSVITQVQCFTFSFGIVSLLSESVLTVQPASLGRFFRLLDPQDLQPYDL
jgi:hypothetical protein